MLEDLLAAPSLSSLETVRQPTGRMASAGALHVKPDQNALFSCICRPQHTPVEAGFTGQEAIEVVDGREAGLGASKVRSSPYTGPQRPPGAPFSPSSGCAARAAKLHGQARLCGHVGGRVGGAVGQDVRLGHFQDWDAGRELVQAAPDDRLLHGKGTP